MNIPDHAIVRDMARKYIWWKTPDDAAAMPHRVVAQVMNIGDFADVQVLLSCLGKDVFRDVLSHAEAGQFSARSWAYWHYRLGLSACETVPPLPVRRIA